ncbi:hypothetical protein [Haloarcula nitratireducens]|uniref:Uncharacterized protein n=1 Tax=Haloarcula nitratireducens TaxID=2487749 RepID=A0AAW4PCZ7_9EURY|nr:hypothetical protein [Halomicroarcula nitratireducens]MBX0295137.1 hypothetical protein [Halomicroarcula nitratireducens]
MEPLSLVLSVAFALLAAVVAGFDAARRGQSWAGAALAVGSATLLACSGVALAADALLSVYAAAVGPVVVTTPRAYLGLLVTVAAAVTAAVLSGYGVLARFRSTA